MNKLSLSGVIVWLSLLPIVGLSSSCMNEEYDMSEKEINLEIAPFQEGVVIPLGSLAPIKLEQLIPSGGGSEEGGSGELGGLGDFFKKDDITGGYAFSYSGGYEVPAETFAELKEMINIDASALSFGDTFDFSMENIDISSVAVDPLNYSNSFDLAKEVSVPQITIPELKGLEESIAAELGKYVPDESQLSPDLEPLEYDHVLLSHGYSVPSGIFTEEQLNAEVELLGENTPEYLKNIFTQELEVDTYEEIPLSIELPEGIESVKEIKLAAGAKITLDFELKNTFLKSGDIIPDVTVDLSQILLLEDNPDGKVDLSDGLSLPTADGYKAHKEINIEGLNISPEDWEDRNGKKVFDKVLQAHIKGDVKLNNLKTTLKLLDEHKSLEIYLKVAFVDVAVQDVAVEIETLDIPYENKIPLEMSYDDIPEGVGKIHVDFEDSYVKLDLNAMNFDRIRELAANLDLDVEFPSELTVHRLLADGRKKEIVADATTGKKTWNLSHDLRNELHETMIISALDIPAPVNGTISLNSYFKVTANAEAKGVIHVEDLINLTKDTQLPAEDRDLKMYVKADPVLKLSDYTVDVDGIEYPLEFEAQKIDVTLPEGFPEVKGLTVLPKLSANGETPKISVKLKIPEFRAMGITPKEDLVFQFPTMLKFVQPISGLPEEFKYDPDKNTITLETGTRLPNNTDFELEIKHIAINPEKSDNPDDKNLYIRGEVNATGALMVKGQLTKEDVDRLAASQEKEYEVLVSAKSPKIEPGTINLDELTSKIESEEPIEITVLTENQLPEMVARIGKVEFEDTYLNLSLKAKDLPAIGPDAELSVNVNVGLPEYIWFADEDGKSTNKTLSRTGRYNPVTGEIEIKPIRIDSLAFNMDGAVLRQGLKESISYYGSVVMNGASLNLDDWINKTINMDMAVSIGNSSDESVPAKSGDSADSKTSLNISKVTGRVDYQIPPIEEEITIGDLGEMLGENFEAANLSLNHLHLALDIETNLCVPVSASVNVIPYKGENTLEPLGTAEPLVLAVDDSPWDEKNAKTNYWLSNDGKGMPGEYTPVEFNLLKYFEDLRSAPDKFVIQLTAGTIPDRDCVLEPLADYVLKADYAMSLPLELGEALNIVYKQVISDMPEILGTVLATGNQVALKGTVDNSLPLALDLEFRFLDSNGDPIDSPKECGKQYIKPCTKDGSACPTELNVLVGVNKDAPNAADIASLELTFTAKDAVAGVPVKPESFLGATLQVALPKGVTVDVADLLNNENSDEDNE